MATGTKKRKSAQDSPSAVSGWDKWDRVTLLPANEGETLARVAKQAVGIIPLSDSRLFVLLKPNELYLFSERSFQYLGAMAIDGVPRNFALHSGTPVIAYEDTVLASGYYSEYDKYCRSNVPHDLFVCCSFESLGKWERSSFPAPPSRPNQLTMPPDLFTSAGYQICNKTEGTPVANCLSKHSICYVYETRTGTECLIGQLGTQETFAKFLAVNVISSATDFVSVAMTSENVLISVRTKQKPCSELYMIKTEDIIQQVSKSNVVVVTAITAFPFIMSSVIAIQEHIYFLGGMDGNMQPVSDVLEYDCKRQSWKEVGYMRTSRFKTIVVYQPKQQCVFVAFGNFAENGPNTTSYAVEKCSLQFGIEVD